MPLESCLSTPPPDGRPQLAAVPAAHGSLGAKNLGGARKSGVKTRTLSRDQPPLAPHPAPNTPTPRATAAGRGPGDPGRGRHPQPPGLSAPPAAREVSVSKYYFQ